MKIGVIIVFNNNALEIEQGLFNSLFSFKSDVHLCLVNNGSRDDTADKLDMLIDTSGLNCTLIDIKKNKGLKFAIKAGVRYFYNEKKFKYFGYTTTKSDLKEPKDLSLLITEIEFFLNNMADYKRNNFDRLKTIKPVFFKI
jgi:hypothetical protein